MRGGLDSHQQRLRLRNLGHFRCRRKAFEGGREDIVRLERTVGRLVKLGERGRGSQFEAARSLLLRDREGGQEGLFRGRGGGGVTLQQNFPARSVKFGVECAKTGAVGRREPLIENRKSAIGITRSRLGSGQR